MVGEDFRPWAETCGLARQRLTPQPTRMSVVSQRAELCGEADCLHVAFANAASPLG